MVEHTRTLGFWVAFSLGLGTMIAAGIFSLSGTAVATVGSSAVISFVLAALIASTSAASYSEFASIYAENGGGYLFSSRTFRRDWLEYAVGASLFLGYTGTTAFYLATMDEWFFEFIVPEWLAIPHGVIGVLAALLLGTLNAKGTEESGTFQLLVSGAKVAVLLAFIGGAFAYQAPAETVDTFRAAFSTDLPGIVSIAALAFITFFGFSAIAASAGEIIDPRRTVPRAIAASIVTVTILYALVIVSMVNAPIPASVIAAEGETAMGRVAAAFIGPWGMGLIVAGAIFSMVSASNASVLAATSIGSLMGRQGQAPRQFSRIHREYGTPFWSVTTVTATIVALIFLFITVFPAEGGVTPLELGLTTLTGFATFNLLAPLSVVNVALIVSRRRYPDIERPVRVPFVPLVPIIGIVANLALITNLPTTGIITGLLVILVLMGSYLVWGGAPETEELFERVVSPYSPAEITERGTLEIDESRGTETAAAVEKRLDEASVDTNRFRVLVPVAIPHRTPAHAALAQRLATVQSDAPLLQFVTVTEIPDQTPSEVAVDAAAGRADRIAEELKSVEFDVDYTVEGHISRDVAFDILQTAREDAADLIVMGYPEESHDVAETIEYKAPCDVVYARGFTEPRSMDVINVGAGGGPHHRALLPVVVDMAKAGAEVHVINVQPTTTAGTPEVSEETLSAFPPEVEVIVHEIEAPTVADGLVSMAAETGGMIAIGATRTRRLRRWVFGSTPDRVIDRAGTADIPVLVYASETTVSGTLEDLLFPIYRYIQTLRSERRPWTEDDGAGRVSADEQG